MSAWDKSLPLCNWTHISCASDDPYSALSVRLEGFGLQGSLKSRLGQQRQLYPALRPGVGKQPVGRTTSTRLGHKRVIRQPNNPDPEQE
ncbi:hypothetical protein WJX72_001246 [[Myrmecia] bisecta]|uniref:Uncharacterized protein n=1 Tax=[Myrmecia] bisecta TaxID=41462 RepID=A0AAW1PN93_9CHLO